MYVKKRMGSTGLSHSVEAFRVKYHPCACAYFKARLDDSDRQHENPRHRPGPASQQHGPQGPGAAVLEEVLLQRVVGAEVEAHARDGPDKRLEEQTTRRGESEREEETGSCILIVYLFPHDHLISSFSFRLSNSYF